MSKAYENISLMLKVILGFALVVAGVAFRPIMYLAALFFVAVILIEKNPRYIASMMFAWLSISPIFKFSVGGTSFFTYLELLVIIKLLIINRKLEVKFFAALALYSAYMMIGMGNEYTDLIKAICVPMLIYFFFKDMSYLSLKSCTFYYIVGIVISSVIGLAKAFIPNMTAFVNYKNVRMGQSASSIIFADRFSGLWTDPNYFSIHLIIAIAVISVLFSRKEIRSTTFYAVYALMVAFGALTGSKSFILMLVVVTVLSVIVLLKEGQYAHSVLFGIVIAIGVFLLMSGYIDVFSRAIYRIQNVSTLGFDTGRSDIWKGYFDMYFDSLPLMLFGSGLGKSFLLRVPHNTYLDIFVLFGIVGGILCIATFHYAIKPRTISMKPQSIVPLITLAAMYFALSMYYSVELPFQMIIVFGYCYLSPDTQNDSMAMESYNAETTGGEI